MLQGHAPQIIFKCRMNHSKEQTAIQPERAF